MTPLEKSPFSFDFNILMFMGAWVVDTKSEIKIKLYAVHKVIMTSIAIGAICTLIFDLYMVFGDFKEMTWNLCITVLFTGSVIKNFFVFFNSHIILRLRKRLHEDSESRTSPEDIAINNKALREFRLIQRGSYGISGVSLAAWIVFRYLGRFRGLNLMPIPWRLPFDVDLDDDFQFNVLFSVLAICGLFGIVLVIETEMSMLGLLIQLTREYQILIKDMLKLNEVYDKAEDGDVDVTKPEFNPWLRRTRTKLLIRQLSTRQKELIGYTEDFERSYNKIMLLQFFVASLLAIVSAMQCILDSIEFSGNVTYQLGYLTVIMSDIFLVCLLSTRLHTQCVMVGQVAYSTFWYQMSTDFQKDIGMIIMRSQNPPIISAGKVLVLDLHAFMHTLRSIYSWLALFRQLAFKEK